jgi:hypothetical protein
MLAVCHCSFFEQKYCLSGGNNGISSEYVRQELRAVVGARTQQQSGSGSGAGQSQGARQQQQQLQLGQQVSPTDLDSLGSLAFEIPTSGE